MEGIAVLVLIGLILLFWVIVYIIAPISGILLAVSLVSSIGYALYTSITSFWTSLVLHKNPYTTYTDESPDAPPGTQRNYFFGPGFHQISVTAKEAFSLQEDRLTELTSWKDGAFSNKWYIDIWIWVFYLAAVLSTGVFGYLWVTIFSVLLSAAIITGMCGFYIFFTLLWCTDRLLLAVKSIQSRCPHCKRISVVPVFICPNCGNEHVKLTPGPYGILKRKCACGEELSTTFFNGRSQYRALCPYCGTNLAASDARQFGIQLVGGPSAGKTTFLASFCHEYLKKLKSKGDISVTATPEPAFEELERWFQYGTSESTNETNANMYSLIHHIPEKTPVQMTIYDIAGEAFTSLGNDMQQLQFQYCEGIIFVVDPKANAMDTTETFSTHIRQLSFVLFCFLTYCQNTLKSS